MQLDQLIYEYYDFKVCCIFQALPIIGSRTTAEKDQNEFLIYKENVISSYSTKSDV